jgi:hypothetical protein
MAASSVSESPREALLIAGRNLEDGMAHGDFRTCGQPAGAGTGKQRLTGSSIVLLLVTCVSLTSCERHAPLAPELAAISCPADRAEHVSTRFAKAEITFVCMTKEIAGNPALLRCAPNNNGYCEDSGMMVFSRLPSGEIVASAPFNALGYEPGPITDPETDKGSMVDVSFYDKPPGKGNWEAGPWQYLREPGQQRIPAGFTLVDGPLCDRVSNALDRGTCKLELASASMHWYVDVSMPRPRGNRIDDSLYDQDLQRWLDLLGKMVVDPAEGLP